MPSYASAVERNSLGATAQLVRSGKCVLNSVRSTNTTGAVAFVQIFDAAAAGDITVGSTIPRWVIEAEASGISAGDGLPEDGLLFENGIVAASTTTNLGNTGATQHVRFGIS